MSDEENRPASYYNKGPILQVLQRFINADTRGSVLELASGSGEHAQHFSQPEAFPALQFQPTEYDASCLPTIQHSTTGCANVLPPFQLDCSQSVDSWSVAGVKQQGYQFALCVNMIHISPWPATLGLFAGLSFALTPGALLFTYGPYNVDHQFTHSSNQEFDVSLKQRNPAWGVRDIGDIEQVANSNGFELIERVPMPFDNFTLVWRRK
jgi:hypothetical protein